MVMIVDDDRDFRKEFRRILEEDYEVIEAADGDEAVEKMTAPNVIDLVILDVKMPGAQGPEVLKRMKQINPEVFIVMLTGYGTKEVLLESLQGHADDYLEKPLKIDKALQIIKTLLEKKNKAVYGIIQKLKYFLDRNFHKEITLKNASDIVCLSPKYVSRIFIDTVGIGFNQYKLRLRMEKARDLLVNSDLTVNEIAFRIGYRNTESFIRIFKKTENTTPGEFRQRNKSL